MRLIRCVAIALLLSGCSTGGPPPVTSGLSPLRETLNTRWLRWPDDNGCAGPATAATLPPGTLIDRFGSEGGNYFSPRGESFGSRALPYVCERTAYTVYRVEKPLPVKVCKAAAWFDEPGGAEQYQTDQPAYQLKQTGVIVAVADGDKAESVCAAQAH